MGSIVCVAIVMILTIECFACFLPSRQDWWNSTSYARFYRTWNCVVHDWLYEYVYRDIVMWQVRGRTHMDYLHTIPLSIHL